MTIGVIILSRRKTHNEYVTEVAIINPNIEVIGQYVNSKTNIEHKCKIDGHIWFTVPGNVLQGQGCPECKRRVLSELHQKTHEQYIEEIKITHPNIEVLEQYIDAKTKILHRCKIDGYEWKTSPDNIIQGRGCPVCSGKAVLMGYNDLLTTHPYLIDEWDYDNNGELLPTMVSHGSEKIINWICKNGHKYSCSIYDKSTGTGCPECNKANKVSEKELIVYYYIRKYFEDAISSYKNNDIYELDVYVPSLKFAIEYDGAYYHQDCEKDKRKDDICYNLGIKLLRIRELGCPKYYSSCSFIYLTNNDVSDLINVIYKILHMLNVDNPDINLKRDVADINSLIYHKKIENSLAVKFPDVASEWHPTKNGSLLPDHVSSKSGKNVWWLCGTCGHEWTSTISNRTDKQQGCPICNGGIAKLIYCPELNQFFNNMHQAKRLTGVSQGNISMACSGMRKTAGSHPITGEPLHWKCVYDQVRKDKTIILGALSLGYITKEDVEEFYKIKTSYIKGDIINGRT